VEAAQSGDTITRVTDAATWSALVGPLTTLLGGLGGYWLAGHNDEARDKRAAAREATARQASLAERLEEQRHTFQRDLLLELQDELHALVRATWKVLMQDSKTLKEHGTMYQLPEGLSDEAFQIGIAIGRLKTRVLDAPLRTAIADLHAACSEAEVMPAALIADGRPADDVLAWINRKQQALNSSYTTVLDRLGEMLRAELDRRSLAGDSAPDATRAGDTHNKETAVSLGDHDR
jgi:hypothetical protein